jgi:hypothetical protein
MFGKPYIRETVIEPRMDTNDQPEHGDRNKLKGGVVRPAHAVSHGRDANTPPGISVSFVFICGFHILPANRSADLSLYRSQSS